MHLPSVGGGAPADRRGRRRDFPIEPFGRNGEGYSAPRRERGQARPPETPETKVEYWAFNAANRSYGATVTESLARIRAEKDAIAL
jgi:hypothetical protein